jgi:hypothetical protein
MSRSTSLIAEMTSAGVSQGVTLSVRGSEVVVVPDCERSERVHCRVLESAAGARIRLVPGDAVLFWRPSPESGRGVVLGRIGPSVDKAPAQEVPDELVLEAKKGLVLRVGEGSITIRADGKILIKGKDLVSHAKRMNRIKGGSVSLN